MSKNKSIDTKKTEDAKGKGEDKNLIPKPMRPILDQANQILLSGKRDKIESLVEIKVRFFSNNMQEVLYVMDDGDGTVELRASELQDYIRKEKKKSRMEHEEQAAKGFVVKMFRRTLVTLPEDINLEEVRALQADPIPGVMAKLLGKTQEEMKNAELTTYESILSYWNKKDTTTKSVMDQYQKKVNPTLELTWSENLNVMSKELLEQKAATERKKAAKQIGSVARGSLQDEIAREAEVRSRQDKATGSTKPVEPMMSGKDGADARAPTPPPIPKPAPPPVAANAGKVVE